MDKEMASTQEPIEMKHALRVKQRFTSRLRAGGTLMILLWCFDARVAQAESHLGICEQQMAAVARTQAIPLGVLYAVAMTETGRRGLLQPYALNVEGKSILAKSRAEAVDEFIRAKRSGAKLIDLGCMQVNHHYHGGEFRSVEDMLDPGMNVTYAARFLLRLREREGSWTMAIARYHAGPDNNPAQQRYICAVIGNLVSTGFGNWTPAARAFCHKSN